MPDLAETIGALADRSTTALLDLHDDYVCTRMSWSDMLVRVARYGENPTIVNPITGSSVDGVVLAFKARTSIQRLRIRVYKDLISQFEIFIGELIRVWLTGNPQSLQGRSITVETILSSKDLAALKAAAIEEAVAAVISDKLFGRPEKWFNYLKSVVGAKVGAFANDQLSFSEFKARRDALEHHDGKIESAYLEKAKAAARYKLGDMVEISEANVDEAYELIRSLVLSTADAVMQIARVHPELQQSKQSQ
jgi:hypothetical protein